MKLTVTNALWVAGAILLGSAIISQLEKSELITSTVLVILSIVILFVGYRSDRSKLACALKSNDPKYRLWFALAFVIILFGMGFAVGKLIYLWFNI